MKMFLFALSLVVLLGASALETFAQDRYSVSDFSDFTQSISEHVIDPIDEPFVVKSLRGQILSSGLPMEGVLIEVQGPNGNRKIKGTRTNANGEFQFHHLKPGRYRFKTTLDNWQSRVGTIIVSKMAKSDPILIPIRPGT
jgi:hypothetical protein